MSNLYDARRWKSLGELRAFLETTSNPVVLLEGTRQLSASESGPLVTLGRKLATELPTVTFRTGNASGSDSAFAEGVAAVDARRLQFLLPNDRMGRGRIPSLSYTMGLESLPQNAAGRVAEATMQATPDNRRLVEHYQQAEKPTRSSQKATYLLRDTLKVMGCAETGLAPATVGIFYVNQMDPMSGGTGHTIRVCIQYSVPVVTQMGWWRWLSA
ncbi:MAG: hypothetical protein WC740_24230 [Verrucomicrobiia bacterium]